MTDNRRVFERFSSDMAIWIRAMREDSDFILVESANISAGGLLFLLEEPIERGSPMELRFELPQNNDLVQAEATVLRVDPQEEGFYLVGVQFTQVKNYPIPVLMAYLEAVYK